MYEYEKLPLFRETKYTMPVAEINGIGMFYVIYAITPPKKTITYTVCKTGPAGDSIAPRVLVKGLTWLESMKWVADKVEADITKEMT